MRASIAAGRLSYTLGLHGPCVTYDTACSAALAAGHAALRALQLAECAVGLVLGVTLMLAPSIGTNCAVAGMTSARGRSHTFDKRADGYARSEACGGVALRPCGEDRGVLGLLGSAVRQDGRSASLTAPNGLAQQSLLVAALHDANTSVDMLALNEVHGTGTALGDPIEVGSLVVAVLSAREVALAVGGVKANIGHAEPAAGMTGLLKLALGLRACEVAPNAQLRALNPYVGGSLREVPCVLPGQLIAGRMGSRGVSSFGYSGTIAHAALTCVTITAIFSRSPALLTYRRLHFPWMLEVQHEDSLASSTPVSVDTALMEYGMTSQQLVHLAASLQAYTYLLDGKRGCMTLSPLIVFEHPTVHGIATYMTKLASRKVSSSEVISCIKNVIEGADVDGLSSFVGRLARTSEIERAPVSTMQEQMLVHQLLAPQRLLYNMAFVLVLPSRSTEENACVAVKWLTDRHAGLRTYYELSDDNTFLQVVLPDIDRSWHFCAL